MIAGGACAVSWTHTVLNHIHRPYLGPLDPLMHVIEFLGKPLTFASVILTLWLVGLALYRDKPLARRYTVAGLAGLALMMALLIGLRNQIEPMISGPTIKYYPLIVENSGDAWYPGREEWVSRWNRGEIWLIDFMLGVTATALIAFASYKWGRLKSTLFWLVPLLVLLVLFWPHVFGLIVSDADFFGGGVYSDALFFDTLLFLVPLSETSIGLTVWFTFITFSIIGIWPKIRKGMAPSVDGSSSDAT
jgi:hypothetical protein